MLLGKTKQKNIEVFISKALIDSYINNEKLVLVNKVLREYNCHERRNQKLWNVCGIHFINVVDVRRKTYEKWFRNKQ